MPLIRVMLTLSPRSHLAKSKMTGALSGPMTNHAFSSPGKYTDVCIVPAAASYFSENTPSAGVFITLNAWRSEEHTSELQSRFDLVCRLLLEKKKHDNVYGDSNNRT